MDYLKRLISYLVYFLIGNSKEEKRDKLKESMINYGFKCPICNGIEIELTSKFSHGSFSKEFNYSTEKNVNILDDRGYKVGNMKVPYQTSVLLGGEYFNATFLCKNCNKYFSKETISGNEIGRFNSLKIALNQI